MQWRSHVKHRYLTSLVIPCSSRKSRVTNEVGFFAVFPYDIEDVEVECSH